MPRSYLPQLDGLRAVAVTFVMAYHFIPGIDRFAPLGTIGVRLFFVLSGFLITRILLAAREQPSGDALRTFYLRRGLRIFPLFYAVLVVAALLNIGPIRQTFAWHATYLTNAYLYARGDWHGPVSHLWSLAVEEQFYLVWPAIVLLAPLRRLPVLIAAMMCASPLLRLMIGGPMNSVLPIGCLDSLGAGALLAIPASSHAVMRAGSIAGAPLVAVALGARHVAGPSIAADVMLDGGVSLLAVWLVGCAAVGFAGAAGAFLAAAPVRYIGTISYGLYMIHGFMPYVLGRYVPGFAGMAWPARTAMLSWATFVTAAISWHTFERPLLALKDRWAALPFKTSEESVHHVGIDEAKARVTERLGQRADNLEAQLLP